MKCRVHGRSDRTYVFDGRSDRTAVFAEVPVGRSCTLHFYN